VKDTRSFEGKRALVTGGAKRLGKEIASALAGAGASVVIHYNTSGAPAEEFCAALEASGTTAVPVQADLDDPAQAEGLFDAAWKALDGIDLLVNNASIFPTGRMDGMTLADLDANVRVNAWAPFLATRAFHRRVKDTDGTGSVVNLLDTRLVGGDLAHAPYHLSKAMLAEITSMTAVEFAPELQVNGVAPGAVMPPEGLGDEYLAGLTAELPLRRRGYPADIAEATLYLLGASFVTGQVIFVDGGRHLRLGGQT
jgi:NAD(P)-dependent dehydrogenase (short-subunit alcohol dehydrogenase family)